MGWLGSVTIRPEGLACQKKHEDDVTEDYFYQENIDFTAKKKLERLQFSTSSSFFKIKSACSCEFKAHF